MNELVIKAKNGNKEAFTQLITNIEDELYKIARTRLNDTEDIFDAIQETMISAYRSIHKLKNERYFKTWIIKILINKCNDIYKTKKVTIVSIDENIKFDDSNSCSEDNLNFEFIMKCLNYDERIAMTLYYLEEYTTKEISEILKTNENTIKTRIRRAKEKIKENLKEVYNNE